MCVTIHSQDIIIVFVLHKSWQNIIIIIVYRAPNDGAILCIYKIFMALAMCIMYVHIVVELNGL